MKQPPGSRKRQSNLSPSLHRNLSSYALAASAATVGLLALSKAAEAEVVYTPAHVLITHNDAFSIDLNHDGITDFTLSNFSESLAVLAPKGNGVKCLPGSCAFTFVYASAMAAGSPIGSGVTFSGSNLVPMAIEGLPLPWDNVRDRYLGLKFEIEGKNHFGWVRLNVQFSSRSNSWLAQLTGYAYETVADRPIKAGQIKDEGDAAARPDISAADPAQIASLGALALGTDGVALWRREESGTEDRDQR